VTTPEQVQAAVRATPAVRTTAASHGVDLTKVTGTGVSGRITVNDVRAAADPAFPARVAAAQQVEDAFRHSTDVQRWPTGSAELDERIRTKPLKLHDISARVAAGPTRPAAATSEPLVQPKTTTYVDLNDGSTPGGVGSVPPLPVAHDGALTAWRYGNADADAAALAARPAMYYRPASGPPDGTE
jgi:cell pole-organizing protein PopZ